MLQPLTDFKAEKKTFFFGRLKQRESLGITGSPELKAHLQQLQEDSQRALLMMWLELMLK